MTTTKKNLLILGCSMTKDLNPAPMPAALRYRGAYYQILHKVPSRDWPQIIILSAKYGFIPGDQMIDCYDQRMDKARAHHLGQDTSQGEILRNLISATSPTIFVAAGELYRSVINNHIAIGLIPTVIYAKGGIGMQRSQLKTWLGTTIG